MISIIVDTIQKFIERNDYRLKKVTKSIFCPKEEIEKVIFKKKKNNIHFIQKFCKGMDYIHIVLFIIQNYIS